MPATRLHERLKELRSTLDLTQKQVAQRIGSKARTVGHWESGKTEPGATHVMRLCELYEVSFDYLMGKTDVRNGLPPDSWIVDIDAFEAAEPDTNWASKIPRRMRLVDFREYERLRSELHRRAKERRGGSSNSPA